LENINFVYIIYLNHFVFDYYLNNKIQIYYSCNQTKWPELEKPNTKEEFLAELRDRLNEFHNEAGASF